MSSNKRKRSSRNTTGYNGVSKRGKRFVAKIRFNSKTKHIGTYGTAKEAALAYDRAVVQHKLPSSKLNYPDGLPIDDEDYDEIMNPQKKRRRSSNNTTGYTGVNKIGKRFQALIYFDGKKKYLGTYDTPKEAALAYDRAVVHHKRPASLLNYPDGLPIDDEDYDELMKSLMNPKKKRRLLSTNTSGYAGVSKNGKGFEAQIYFDRKNRNLGIYNSPKEAALAYDRAVVQHKLSSSRLNFPNDYTTSSEDESRTDESDGSSGDNDHNDGNNDSNEDALKPPAPPPTQPYFERDPMLDQLVAEEQNKRQQEEQEYADIQWV
jgi:hypothetical protein